MQKLTQKGVTMRFSTNSYPSQNSLPHTRIQARTPNASKNLFCNVFSLQKSLFFCALFLSLLFQGCKDGNLTMATAAEFRPFEYVESSEIKGIDIDIAKEIAKRLDKKLEIKNMKFDSVISTVNSGVADIAISSITINSVREKIIDFSTPYYEASQMVIVKNNDSRFVNISSKEELLDKINSIKGLKIAVAVSTTGSSYVMGDKELGFSGFDNATPKAYTNSTLALKALIYNQADIMIIDEMPATMLTRTNPTTSLLPFRLTEEHYGIAINKQKPKLKKSIQKALDEMKNDGTLEAIISKYL